MRLLTFSFLKNSNLKTFLCRVSRQLSTSGAAVVETAKPTDKPTADPSLVEISPSWPADEHVELRSAVLRDMKVYPDFVSESEESELMAELEPYLKRMRYEFDHWDNAIQGYRETERSTWTDANRAVLQRVEKLAFTDTTPLPYIHVLDLAANGHIKPHVDAVRFCGRVIAGICLCSSAIMRLQHSKHEHLVAQALLQRRALYVMKDVSRYEFSHAVLGGPPAEWHASRGTTKVVRQRRVALITRSQPERTD